MPSYRKKHKCRKSSCLSRPNLHPLAAAKMGTSKPILNKVSRLPAPSSIILAIGMTPGILPITSHTTPPHFLCTDLTTFRCVCVWQDFHSDSRHSLIANVDFWKGSYRTAPPPPDLELVIPKTATWGVPKGRRRNDEISRRRPLSRSRARHHRDLDGGSNLGPQIRRLFP
jgi:hypothetical protein